MVRFYDPRDAEDLARVEKVLKENAIEYFLREEPADALGPAQVHVAEEDLPAAEEALQRSERPG